MCVFCVNKSKFTINDANQWPVSGNTINQPTSMHDVILYFLSISQRHTWSNGLLYGQIGVVHGLVDDALLVAELAVDGVRARDVRGIARVLRPHVKHAAILCNIN